MEIAHYKRLAPELFEIVDISDPKFDAAKFGLTRNAVNKHMHLLTPEGQLLIGVDAFAHIWSLVPRYKFAETLVKAPVIHGLAKIGYSIFANVRPLLPKKKR